jgi:hypothetical protein
MQIVVGSFEDTEHDSEATISRKMEVDPINVKVCMLLHKR